tara:strand:- start:46 stop:807 length:762 start_codon:yes stop_codon:yes gene_type:complete
MMWIAFVTMATVVISVVLAVYLTRKSRPHDPIFVMITSIPSRLGKCERVVNSLTWDQKRRPDRLFVTIPESYQRFPDARVEVPGFLERHPIVSVLRVKTDYGPATKFLGPLLFSDIPPNATVVVTDDDTPKLPGWLEYLDNKLSQHPNAVITLSTHPAGEVHGGRGFAFKRGTFDAKDLLEQFERRPECRLIDDDFLTHYARTHNIPIIKGSAKGLFIPESAEFTDKLRDLKDDSYRPRLRGPCAATFGQPSL